MNAKMNLDHDQMIVPFHNTNLTMIEHAGQPYVPMKPVVKGMGLDWKSQYRKITNRFKGCMVKMTIQLLGDTQKREVIMLPLRKLPAWLYSVEPNRVKLELKLKVIQYQEECDDVLWNHWTGKLSARQRAFDDFNKIEFDDKLSKAKGAISSLGMHVRKREKKINDRRRQDWLSANVGVLDFGD